MNLEIFTISLPCETLEKPFWSSHSEDVTPVTTLTFENFKRSKFD